MSLDSLFDPEKREHGAYLETLIQQDFERCHPGQTLDDLKRRAPFSKEDKGLYRDWMVVALRRAEAEQALLPQHDIAA